MTTIASPSVPRSRPQGRVEDEPLYEIIDGQRVELPPMSILASRVASRLFAQLGHHLHGKPVGEALVEALVHLPLPVDRNRRPEHARSQEYPRGKSEFVWYRGWAQDDGALPLRPRSATGVKCN